MNNLILFLATIFLIHHPAFSQVPITEIEGFLEVYHPEDTTSMYIGHNGPESPEIRPWGSLFGAWNTIIGSSSAHSLTSGTTNTLVGGWAGRNVSEGSSNTILGGWSGVSIENGSSNTIVGFVAGNYIMSEHSNTFLGRRSGNNIKGSNNIMIGHEAGYQDVTLLDSVLFIDVQSTFNPLIFGEFRNDKITFNGDIHIGGTSEGANTDANSRLYMRGASQGYEEIIRKNSNNGDLAIGVVSGTGKLNVRANGATYITISSSGNVGLGVNTIPTDEKLHVHGNVKIENLLKLKPQKESEAGTCDNSLKGSVYYESTNDSIRFCNGSKWLTLSSF